MSGLLDAAYRGDGATMKQLLVEGASITERDVDSCGVLHYAAANAQHTAMRWLLLEAGASIGKVEHEAHSSVWNYLVFRGQNSYDGDLQLSAVLKVMVMLEDAPCQFHR